MLVNRRQNFKGKKLLDVACDHCGYRIHLSKDCYRIIGYPADFKSKRKQLPAYPQGNTVPILILKAILVIKQLIQCRMLVMVSSHMLTMMPIRGKDMDFSLLRRSSIMSRI
ncbi:hypothetical protein RDI58_005451 [Solanum bulbocastanum]|uniref:CCHC-type domain-containing protein n=1 Tax=Solanum bulbocastanum TaxID=147425 RepID=A0AAN8U398_SOLBU